MIRQELIVDLDALQTKKKKATLVTDEKIQENIHTIRQYLSFFRSYPDIFIDMISAPDCPVKLFFYQRMVLRIIMRYKYIFITFNRAFGKSFLSVMALYLKCMFYPNIKLFICSGGKDQIT